MNWGLALSGGAACGLANVGILEVLEENGYRPGAISGSSMGAIVAGLYALGYPPSQIRAVAAKLSPVTVVEIASAPFRGGLHGGFFTQRLEEHLAPLIADATIADCDIPFVCVAGRVLQPIQWQRALRPGFTEHVLESVDLHVFDRDTRVLDALRASSAVPVIFSPARVGDDEFVDLVHFGAIPVLSLKAEVKPAPIIATDTMPAWDRLEPWLPPAIKEFMMTGREMTEKSIAAADLVIRPPLPATAFRFDQGHSFADSGRDATESRLGDIAALLKPVGG